MQTISKVRLLFHKKKLSQREIAKRLNLNRRTVAKYLEVTEPPNYQRANKHFSKLAPFVEQLEQRLQEEQLLPKSQRLSALRHYEWLKAQGFTGSYSTITHFIRSFKGSISSDICEGFIPLYYSPGDAYQFDWSTETIKLAGQLIKVKVAHFRLCHSRAFYFRAYFNEQQEMLIDAHNHAFNYFEGVPLRGIYDNMRTAVKTIKAGKERDCTLLFDSMMNHFLVEPVFCTPAEPQEKGQIERQVNIIRQKLFKPTLSVDSLEELNDYLQTKCVALSQQMKHPKDKTQTIAQSLEYERNHLSKITPFLGKRSKQVAVNSLSQVHYDTHKYSVPCNLARKNVQLWITATTIGVEYDNKLVAEHKRSFIKHQCTYNPWHYLELLKKKPGALRNGEPFIHWILPKPIQQLQGYLLKRPKGDRAMVQLLSLIAEYGEDLGVTAAEVALEEGIPTVEAVLNIIHRLKEPPIPTFNLQTIALTIVPQANCERYNHLLSEVSYAKA